MTSFKSSENIQKKEDGPDRSVSDNQSSSVTLQRTGNESLKRYCNFEIQRGSHTVRLLVPGHFYFYVVSKFLLRENDISVLLF